MAYTNFKTIQKKERANKRISENAGATINLLLDDSLSYLVNNLEGNCPMEGC